EHVLEHFDYAEEVPCFLDECYRVLSDGGVLRIVVPDAGGYLEAYCRDGWDDISSLHPLDEERRDSLLHIKYNTKMELINDVFRKGWEHKYAYDFETLALALHKHGFHSIQKLAFGESHLPGGCIDNPRRARQSLYVEAVK